MNITTALSKIASEYPPELRAGEHRDIPRIAWHIEMLSRYVRKGSTVADIGGGTGLMSPGLAAAGYRSILLDDFRDPVNTKFPISRFSVHQDVKVISADATQAVDAFEQDSLDAVTCFESIEHWHSSPRPMFRSLMRALRPGGVFFLGVPNCVDLKKRITTPLGLAEWSAMKDWYDEPVFRGHVREARVADLHYIARDLGLTKTRIVGRNWQVVLRFGSAGRAADAVLRSFPSLCSDIYLIARQPKGSPQRY